MKKIIPVLAILGSAAALLAYKMKKDEQKHIVDLDQGLLHDEDLDETMEEVEEGPISEPQSCCMNEVEETIEEVVDDVKDVVKDTSNTIKDTLHDVKENVCNTLEDYDLDFTSLLKDEVQQLKEKAKEIMEGLRVEGDVHEHERPVQHAVKFASQEDADNFKNEVINKGFVITKGKEDGELIILHITPLDKIKLVPNILYIANEARKNHGTYVGWTSKVIF